jgi:hypothetical protein
MKNKNNYDPQEGYIISLYNILAKKEHPKMVAKGSGLSRANEVINSS